MARLCLKMSPVLTESVIDKLAERKIFTVIDVLKEDPKRLSLKSDLEFKDILSLRQTLVTDYCPFPQQGFDAYNELVSNCACIPSGIESLDKILGGGFITGNIYEICGMCGAGKTQLCVSLAINEAQQQKRKVHFVDTKADFSGKRILSILDARIVDAEEIGNVMERILVTRVHGFFELYSFLSHFKDQMVTEPGSTRLIIIESLPAIFFQFMGNLKMDSLGFMNCLASLMKYIAQEQHVTFIVINLATKWVEDDSAPLTDCESELKSLNPCVEIKPVLGKYWVHIPNTRLYLEKQDKDYKKITIIKSTHLAVGKFSVIKFVKSGVL